MQRKPPLMYDEYEPGILGDVNPDYSGLENMDRQLPPAPFPGPYRVFDAPIPELGEEPRSDNPLSRMTQMNLESAAGIDYNDYLPPMEKESSAYRRFQEIAQQQPQFQKPGIGRRLAAVALAGLGGYVNAGGRVKVDMNPAVEGLNGVTDLERRTAMWKGNLETAARAADAERQRNMEMNTAENARAATQRANNMLKEQQRRSRLDEETIRVKDDANRIKELEAKNKAERNMTISERINVLKGMLDSGEMSPEVFSQAVASVISNGSIRTNFFNKSQESANNEKVLTEARVKLMESQARHQDFLAKGGGQRKSGSGIRRIDPGTQLEITETKTQIRNIESEIARMNRDNDKAMGIWRKWKDADLSQMSREDVGEFKAAQERIREIMELRKEAEILKGEQYKHLNQLMAEVKAGSGGGTGGTSTGTGTGTAPAPAPASSVDTSRKPGTGSRATSGKLPDSLSKSKFIPNIPPRPAGSGWGMPQD